MPPPPKKKPKTHPHTHIHTPHRTGQRRQRQSSVESDRTHGANRAPTPHTRSHTTRARLSSDKHHGFFFWCLCDFPGDMMTQIISTEGHGGREATSKKLCRPSEHQRHTQEPREAVPQRAGSYTQAPPPPTNCAAYMRQRQNPNASPGQSRNSRQVEGNRPERAATSTGDADRRSFFFCLGGDFESNPRGTSPCKRGHAGSFLVRVTPP